MKTELVASVSMDLDNQWSYMKTHGDAGWESLPSYFDTLVPTVLEALDELDLEITFFVVGNDAAQDRNRDTLALLTKHGHEIGSHSYHHEQWMCELPREQIQRELAEARTAIQHATGQEPLGYRGPGFSWSPELLDLLAEEGYLYDASTFPTYIGPLARMYYFWQSSLDAAEREKRKSLFGTFADGRRPLKPYRWKLPQGRSLLEIPVTTVPIVKTPFHLSYLLYLSRYSHSLMLRYLETALRLCRWTGTEPSFLLHPLDLLAGEQVPELAFFPGMELPAARKAAVFDRVLREIGEAFTLVTMGEHARRVQDRDLPLREAAA